MIRSKLHLLSALILISLSVNISVAQTPSSESVQSARPVNDILNKLQLKYGWAVNFEEPRYLYAGDREDVSEEVRARRGLAQPVHGYYAHRAVPLTLEISGIPNRQTPPERETLQRLVEAYNASQGHEYELREGGNRFSIVGIGAKDEYGRFQNQPPILDLHVDLEPKERDGNAVLIDLCKKLWAVAGVQVSYGRPSHALAQMKFAKGFSGSARDILTEVLNQSRLSCKSSWSLLYGPSDDSYGLSVVYYGSDQTDPCSPPASSQPPSPQSNPNKRVITRETKP